MSQKNEQSCAATLTQSETDRKTRFSQFFTSAEIARFMASLFSDGGHNFCRLLDAGAGAGALSTAFLDQWIEGNWDFKSVELDVFEIDRALMPRLRNELDSYRLQAGFSLTVRNCDFIHAAADWVSGNFLAEPLPKYTHAILNPPYQKIRSDSAHRSALRRAGIETVNLYSAFVGLALALLGERGQLVAIIPRSFCNGPYYRPFREYLLSQAAVRRIHLFGARNQAFKNDDVLQENIIILLERGGEQRDVRISTSTDGTFADMVEYDYAFEQVVFPDDPEKFIHVPVSSEPSTFESLASIRCSLTDLGLRVSTGPVVDFRVRENLRSVPEQDTVPLIYPGHFSGMQIVWPNPNLTKPNAIAVNDETKKWLYPNGAYCVVRRFSSKEEKRRVVAAVIDPASIGNSPWIGFENHLNVFHRNKSGLSIELAQGLAVYLNTTVFDEFFRRFSGHTQVNVTDLKQMNYPDRYVLDALGRWALGETHVTQEKIDMKFLSLVR